MPRDIIAEVLKDQMRNTTEFNPGDTIKVTIKIVEEKKVRRQTLEGVVIKKRGSGSSATFTIRRLSHEVGVEHTFPLHSPSIEKIAVVSEGKVRRAKLYYLRNRSGKATVKVKQKVTKKTT